MHLRIHELIKDGKDKDIVDVDGSYLYKKYKMLQDAGVNVSDLSPPSAPATGWITLTPENCVRNSTNNPPVTSGKVAVCLCIFSVIIIVNV